MNTWFTLKDKVKEIMRCPVNSLQILLCNKYIADDFKSKCRQLAQISVPQMNNVSEKVWKRKGRPEIMRCPVNRLKFLLRNRYYADVF